MEDVVSLQITPSSFFSEETGMGSSDGKIWLSQIKFMMLSSPRELSKPEASLFKCPWKLNSNWSWDLQLRCSNLIESICRGWSKKSRWRHNRAIKATCDFHMDFKKNKNQVALWWHRGGWALSFWATPSKPLRPLQWVHITTKGAPAFMNTFQTWIAFLGGLQLQA